MELMENDLEAICGMLHEHEPASTDNSDDVSHVAIES